MNIIKHFNNYFSLLHSQIEICATIISIYNCRASEILSAEWKFFFPGEYLILLGKKKSANVIVRDRLILESIDKLPRSKSGLIFDQVNYNKLYRFFLKRYDNRLNRFIKKKNKKVTHAPRYTHVERFDNEKIIKDILHHNSLKSGEYYKLKKKGTK